MSEVVRAHYGKARIPLLKVERGRQPHLVFQAVVSIDTEGARIVDAYMKGDNSAVLPTDTMKNLVYALAFEQPIRSSEEFARLLARRFLARYATIERLEVTVEAADWQPIVERQDGAERANPISFRLSGGQEDFTRVGGDRGGLTIESGVRRLTVLKTTDSAFSGFLVDEYTTLAETEDRILATSLSGSWKLPDAALDFRAVNRRIVETLVGVFARFRSRSVQDLAHEMATTVLSECPEVLEISLTLPNLHCYLIDLSAFGLRNEDAVYLPSDSPHGDLHLTMRR